MSWPMISYWEITDFADIDEVIRELWESQVDTCEELVVLLT